MVLPLIEQTAKVVSVDDDKIWLQTERQTSCGQCKLKQGCGTGLLDNHVGKRFSTLSVPVQAGIQPQQQLTVAISENKLLYGAVLMYLLPLLSLLLFAIFARWSGAGSEVEVIAGLLGLATGFGLARMSLKNKEDSFAVLVKEEIK